MSLLVNWLESLHSELEVTDRCSRRINLNSTCTICVETCSEKAITVEETRISIHSNRCSMCGECVVSCPLSAIDGTGPVRTFQEHALVYDETYTPTIKELLIYKKRGIHTILAPKHTLDVKWKTLVEDTNKVLMILDEPPYEIILPQEAKDLSRRAFFTSMQKEGKHLLKSMTPAEWRKETWKLSHHFPEFQFYSVKVNSQKCTLCGACMSVCRNQVISIIGTAFRIQNQACTDCTSCRDVCPETAIEVSKDVQKAKILTYDMFEKECQECKQLFFTFQAESNHCHLCDNRDPEWLSPYT